ncbi:MAG: DNA polymerase Y family protein [Planctomycetota bacterium]
MRALCISLPRWSTDRRRRVWPSEWKRLSLVTVRPVASREVVASACANAATSGVVPGMALAHARALVPAGQLRIEPDDPRADAEVLIDLGRWLYRRLPKVMPVKDWGSDAVLAEITGCERLFRGEHRMVEQLGRALHRSRITARIASAPTFGAAWALAHFAESPFKVVSDTELAFAIEDLPVRSLRIDAESSIALEDVGIETIGQLEAMPRASLPSRFSADLLLRLDQAYGRALETITPLQIDEPVIVRRRFAGPVKNLEAVTLAGRELVDQLCALLLQRESGTRGLRLDLERYEAEDLLETLSLGRASRDAKHLWRLFAPKLEGIHLGHGIESVSLTATQTISLAHQQLGPQRPEIQHERELGELLDVLDARLGPSRVSRITVRESHDPRKVFGLRSAKDANTPTTVCVTTQERPSRLLHPPRPIRVIAVTPDGPVVRLTWEGVDHQVTHCFGPERIGSEWWRSPPPPESPSPPPPEAASPQDSPQLPEEVVTTSGGGGGGCDYYRLGLDDGRWLWVSRETVDEYQHRWLVQGLWA